jgi:Tfp pilus assembly protein PilF
MFGSRLPAPVYPEQVDVLNNYGMLLHSVLGDFDKAETMYQCALKVCRHPRPCTLDPAP